METEECQSPLQGRTAACIKGGGKCTYIRVKASKRRKPERNREKSGKLAWISERDPGQISKRHGIPEVMRDTTIQANI